MDGWIDRSMDGWIIMGGLMDGWINGLIEG